MQQDGKKSKECGFIESNLLRTFLCYLMGLRFSVLSHARSHTGCPRRNVKYFGRVFLMLNYTDITQNTYIQSLMVTEIMTIEKCGLLGSRRTVAVRDVILVHCPCRATPKH